MPLLPTYSLSNKKMVPPADGIVSSFVITAAFDVALNLLPPPIGATVIRPYFDEHTVLSAALVAGFVGAVTFCVIVALYPSALQPSFRAAAIVFAVSALMGTPMRLSKLFPHLEAHYYSAVPRWQTFCADGLSGVMVAVVYWAAYTLSRNSR